MDLGDLNSICENFDFQLSKHITVNLKKTLCKQFYKLLIEEINTEPTRQFYFKLLHRILVTNKELKRFGITDCDKCVMCGENDSIEHALF